MVINLLLVSFLPQPTDFNHYLFTILNIVSYTFCITHWLKCGGSFFSLYSFFILYTAFSNLSQSVLYLFNVSGNFLYLYSLVSFNWIFEVVRFESLCSAALNLGTVMYIYKSENVATLGMRQKAYANLVPVYNSRVKFFEFLLSASLLYIVIVCLTMISMRRTMSYADFFAEGRGELNFFFSGWLKYGAIALPIWALFSKHRTTFVYLALGFFVIALLLVGSRGLAIRYIAIVLITLPITYPNLFKKRFTILWIVVAFVAFSFLSVISTSRKENLSGDAIQSGNSVGYNALATMSEIGGAARPAALTMEANENGMLHYQTILVSVVRAVIPLSSNLHIVQEHNISLAEWVTNYAGSYWSGLGYSDIGEVYMNYSWYGWIFMLFYGWFIAFAENTSYRLITKRKYLTPVVLLTILIVHLVWARGQISDFVGIWRSSLYLLILGLFFKEKTIQHDQHN